MIATNTQMTYNIETNSITIKLIDSRADRVSLVKELRPVLKAAYNLALVDICRVISYLRTSPDLTVTLTEEADLEPAELADLVDSAGGVCV
jgi:hypothetical protein